MGFLEHPDDNGALHAVVVARVAENFLTSPDKLVRPKWDPLETGGNR